MGDVAAATTSSRAPAGSAPTRRSTTATVDVGKEIRARTGKRGVDVVVDNVGEATWEQSLGALGGAAGW